MSSEPYGDDHEDDAGYSDPEAIPPFQAIRANGGSRGNNSDHQENITARQPRQTWFRRISRWWGNLFPEGIRPAEWFMIILTGFTALATIVLACVAVKQLGELENASNQTDRIIYLQGRLEQDARRQAGYTNNLATSTGDLSNAATNTANAAVTANRIQGSDFEADERPWLQYSRDACPPAMTGAQNPAFSRLPSGRVGWNICFRNFGKQPAIDVSVEPYMSSLGSQLVHQRTDNQKFPIIVPGVPYLTAVISPGVANLALDLGWAPHTTYGQIILVRFKYHSPAGKIYVSYICLANVKEQENSEMFWTDCHPDAILRVSQERVRAEGRPWKGAMYWVHRYQQADEAAR